MRLRYVLSFAAALALAGCGEPAAKKAADAARTPLPATAAAPACPPAPACVPQTATAKPSARAGASRKAVAHKASHRTASRKALASHRHQRAYRDEGLAGGPPERRYRRWDGRSPEPGYAYRRYGEGGYRYGALPRDWDDDGRRYDDRRYDDQRDDGRRYDDGDWGPPPNGSGYYYRRHGDNRPADRYGPGAAGARGDERSTERYSSHDSEGARRQGGYSRDGADHDYEALRGEDRATSGYAEQRNYRGGRWMRAERRDSETSTSSYTERTTSGSYGGGSGPCCGAGAAGFDANGYLSWPGKVPARP
jgi:hypothetical protein